MLDGWTYQGGELVVVGEREERERGSGLKRKRKRKKGKILPAFIVCQVRVHALPVVVVVSELPQRLCWQGSQPRGLRW